jgi:nucleotide-binding universal stress UspA family protein
MISSWKRICCPLDFSDPSRAALEVAVDLGVRLGSELTLLYVDELEKVAREPRSAEPVEAQLSAWKADAERSGARDVTTARASGQVEVAIVEYAARAGVDLIVMGTHGRTDRPGMLTGSVAEGVVRTARCPVLTVRRPG